MLWYSPGRVTLSTPRLAPGNHTISRSSEHIRTIRTLHRTPHCVPLCSVWSWRSNFESRRQSGRRGLLSGESIEVFFSCLNKMNRLLLKHLKQYEPNPLFVQNICSLSWHANVICYHISCTLLVSWDLTRMWKKQGKRERIPSWHQLCVCVNVYLHCKNVTGVFS